MKITWNMTSHHGSSLENIKCNFAFIIWYIYVILFFSISICICIRILGQCPFLLALSMICGTLQPWWLFTTRKHETAPQLLTLKYFQCYGIQLMTTITSFWDSHNENLFAWRWWYRWFCICICCRLLRVLSMFWLAVTLTRVSAGLLIFWSSTPWHWWSLLYWLSWTVQAPQHDQCSMNFPDWRHFTRSNSINS